MASAITTEALRQKVMKLAMADPKAQALSEYLISELVKDAIIASDRELHECDSLMPLAWNKVPYSGFRTVAPADISAITQADPGVITCESQDDDVTGHGFDNHETITDIVTIHGIDGMESLNDQQFLLEYIDADTFSLKSLDSLDNDIVTTTYGEYSSGGTVYHAGFVLPAATILTGVSAAWTIKQLLPSPRFDGRSTDPIGEDKLRHESQWLSGGYAQRPSRYRYWKHLTTQNAISHYIFWYPPANDQYNVEFIYEKEVPDISTWTTTAYPLHPNEVHQTLIYGACYHLINAFPSLAPLAAKWEPGKRKAKRLSRALQGQTGGMQGIGA